MTYFTNAASDLFAAMSLATIEDALRADEEENAVRLNEWKNGLIRKRSVHIHSGIGMINEKDHQLIQYVS